MTNADGRYVAFQTQTVMPPCCGTPVRNDNIWVRDTVSGTTTLVSRDAGGLGADGESQLRDMTADDGVLFASRATNLAGAPSDGSSTLFLYDVSSNTITKVASASPCPVGQAPTLTGGSISADGTKVAYITLCQGGAVRYVRLDRATNATAVVGTCVCDETIGPIVPPAMSRDGRVVAWGENTSTSGVKHGDLLVSTDGNPAVRSATPATVVNSVSPSATNRFVACTWSQDWVGFESIGPSRLYLLDRSTGATRDIAANFVTQPANGSASGASFSADDHEIAFTSSSSDLVANDQNGASDVFVRDLTKLVSDL